MIDLGTVRPGSTIRIPFSTFDKDDGVELERAKRMISDMLRRGYAIFVEIAEKLQRVRAFDAAKGVYYISDVPDWDSEVLSKLADEPPARPAPLRQGRNGRKHRGRKGIPMRTAKATAVGRTAGG